MKFEPAAASGCGCHIPTSCSSRRAADGVIVTDEQDHVRHISSLLIEEVAPLPKHTVEELVPHRATGYHWMDSDKYQNAPIVPGGRPSGALRSSVLDLAKWDAALDSGEVFSPQQRELMWAPVKLNDGSEKPYGFGWEVGKIGQHRR